LSSEDILDMTKPSTIGYDSLFGKRLIPPQEEVDSYLFEENPKDRQYIFLVLKIMKRFHLDTERDDSFFHNHNRLQDDSESGSDFKDSQNGDRPGSMVSGRSSLKGSLMNLTFQSASPTKKGRYGMFVSPQKRFPPRDKESEEKKSKKAQ
jgi:hypothetical protein